jgi:hypothetical protein
MWNIAFTDEPPQRGQTPCPASVACTQENREAWPGNQPKTREDIELEQERWRNELEDIVRRTGDPEGFGGSDF